MDEEQLWFDTFNSQATVFENARPNFDQLDADTQTIGALVKLELDMYNGGFVQFFCNWGHDAYLFAIQGLEKIKAGKAKAIIKEAFEIIDSYEDDARLTKLWDLPSVLSDDDKTKLDQLDEQYWEDEDQIMETMLNHFRPLRST